MYTSILFGDTLFKNYLNFLCMNVLHACKFNCILQCLQWSEEGVGSLGTVAMDSY